MNEKVMIIANHAEDLYKVRKELIEELVNQKYQVYIAIPQGDYTDKLQNMGCKILDIFIDRRGTNLFKDLKTIGAFYQYIKKIKPDIVLTYTIKPNIYGGMVCSKRHIPYITNITGLGSSIKNGGLMAKISLFLYKIALKRANCVFFQNSENLKIMLDNHIVKENYKLIPGSGVNLSEKCLADYPSDDNIRFIYIGRIMKDKGIEEYLQVAEKIKGKYDNVEFTIIGKFEEKKYDEIIKKLQNENIIKYYGQVDQVYDYIKKSHCMIHPSYHEGMSNVLLENAAIGRPAIAFDIAGCKEIIDNEKTGFIGKPKEVDDLYEKVEKFIQLSYDEKKKMGIEARKKVEKEFDRKIVVKSYTDKIEEILKLKER